jgi:hypothetical protein
VTLLQIAEMVRAGEDVQIIDNATKEDKTEVTLALIISEELKSQPRSVPLGTLRDLIHQRGERLLSQLREGPIGRLIPGAALDSTGEAVPENGPPSSAQGGEVDPGPVSADARVGGGEGSRSDWGALEQWRRGVDERIRTALATFSSFRELQTRIEQLSKRVADLEAELGRRSGSGRE